MRSHVKNGQTADVWLGKCRRLLSVPEAAKDLPRTGTPSGDAPKRPALTPGKRHFRPYNDEPISLSPSRRSTMTYVFPDRFDTARTVPAVSTLQPPATLVDGLDQQRLTVSPTLEKARRKALGQFMTPGGVARTMAGMVDMNVDEVRLLDAGAGMGALAAAFVEAAVRAPTPPKVIDVTAYEIDPVLSAILERTLSDCGELCAAAGIAFSSRIVRADYILSSGGQGGAVTPTYTAAILNPPYGQISASSAHRCALKALGVSASNLYAAFVSLALTQLAPGGQLVAVTPRSFCNGPTHRGYRAFLLETAVLEALQSYQSRRGVFREDGVLQEVVVMKLRKAGVQGAVLLGSDDGEARSVPVSDIVWSGDVQRVIRLPLDPQRPDRIVAALPCTLPDLGISVSTGRVIEYREREHLRSAGEAATVPLLYPQHMREARVAWPVDGFRKSDALADIDATRSLIMPAGAYVLVKRISAKEDARRIRATLYQGGRAAFENHLNVFHAGGIGLPVPLARGLVAYLNSEAVDAFIRTVSGTTQINATDLRALPYPAVRELLELGEETSGSVGGDFENDGKFP
ncbi:Eco57I restriction-modification methylase domain-containing protein [Sagittula salina]|uniref:site-specific DNA-methyltransferase (adenine-specific) n=1 Tax=Sagittula salina TaxID=2820268 RepID=A0A940MRD1_9RHOB|nr:Eco57I restriction-modification methylase domain-containing protein [Sagittula salina]MBP0484513.1 Eco57I restriction-modification methylase domain-containing protein [Sagittula salina]